MDEHNHYEADVAATCALPEGSAGYRRSFLIVEALSESARTHDLGVKVPRCIELPSAQEIGLIDVSQRWVQV